MNPLVEQILLVGQDQKQLAGLIVPNQDGLDKYVKNRGLEGNDQEKLLNLLKIEFNHDLQARLGSRPEERLCGVALVKAFTIENGLLTQTLKQRRNEICARDREDIERMYRVK